MGVRPIRSRTRQPGPVADLAGIPSSPPLQPAAPGQLSSLREVPLPSSPSSSYRLVTISELVPRDAIQCGHSFATGQCSGGDGRESPQSLLPRIQPQWARGHLGLHPRETRSRVLSMTLGNWPKDWPASSHPEAYSRVPQRSAGPVLGAWVEVEGVKFRKGGPSYLHVLVQTRPERCLES